MAEIVTVEKYKSLNGYTYDKLADAERADAEWREENEYDLEKDIAQLTKDGNRELINLQRRDEKHPGHFFPKLYVLDNKYEKIYYLAKSVNAVPKIFFEILKFNEQWGCYTEPAAKAISREIVRTENQLAAIAFVQERITYQYENVYTESVTIYEA